MRSDESPICKDKEYTCKVYDQCDTRQLTLVRSLASAKLSFLTDRILSRITAENLMLIDFFYCYCQWLFYVERKVRYDEYSIGWLWYGHGK